MIQGSRVTYSNSRPYRKERVYGSVKPDSLSTRAQLVAWHLSTLNHLSAQELARISNGYHSQRLLPGPIHPAIVFQPSTLLLGQRQQWSRPPSADLQVVYHAHLPKLWHIVRDRRHSLVESYWQASIDCWVSFAYGGPQVGWVGHECPAALVPLLVNRQ